MFCGSYYDVQALAAYAESGRPLTDEQKKCLRDAGYSYYTLTPANIPSYVSDGPMYTGGNFWENTSSITKLIIAIFLIFLLYKLLPKFSLKLK